METKQSKNTTNKKPKQRLAFPIYDEEDILNWDATIVTPPPRRSGTIRVKLKYEETSNPFRLRIPRKNRLLAYFNGNIKCYDGIAAIVIYF